MGMTSRVTWNEHVEWNQRPQRTLPISMLYSPIFLRIYRNVALLHHRTSMGKYGILTTYQATANLGAPATKLLHR